MKTLVNILSLKCRHIVLFPRVVLKDATLTTLLDPINRTTYMFECSLNLDSYHEANFTVTDGTGCWNSCKLVGSLLGNDEDIKRRKKLPCNVFQQNKNELCCRDIYLKTRMRIFKALHYDDVIMTMLASQITSLAVVYSIVYSGVNQRKHQSSASLAFVREIHRGPVNFPHKWPVTRKMFPFDDVIMGSINISI